jgi:hypothetical protein
MHNFSEKPKKKWSTCKVRNETKRNQSKRNETDRNETKPNEMKPNETKIQNQNEMKFLSLCFRLL